jgi:hypothetical protein
MRCGGTLRHATRTRLRDRHTTARNTRRGGIASLAIEVYTCRNASRQQDGPSDACSGSAVACTCNHSGHSCIQAEGHERAWERGAAGGGNHKYHDGVRHQQPGGSASTVLDLRAPARCDPHRREELRARPNVADLTAADVYTTTIRSQVDSGIVAMQALR